MPAGYPRKIGIVCCIHPDEEKSREVYEHLHRTVQSYPDIEVILGNPLAYEQGRRFSEGGVNLNLAFPGNPDSPIYEERRAAELVKWAAKFDIVLDIHGSIEEDHLWLHPEANLTLRGLARYLGMNKIVVVRKGTMTAAVSHTATIELAPDTTITPRRIKTVADDLALGAQWVEDTKNPYQWYEHLYDLPQEEGTRVLPDSLPSFTPLPPRVIEHFGLHPQAYSLGWSRKAGWIEAGIRIEDPWHTQARERRARNRVSRFANSTSRSARLLV